MPEQTGLQVRIIYYPFMGNNINTERLLLMTRLCYAPLGTEEILNMVHGQNEPTDEEAGRFVRGLVQSGHLGACSTSYQFLLSILVMKPELSVTTASCHGVVPITATHWAWVTSYFPNQKPRLIVTRCGGFSLSMAI